MGVRTVLAGLAGAVVTLAIVGGFLFDRRLQG
jgi:hypothetical protein